MTYFAPDRIHGLKRGRSAVSPKPKIEARAFLDVEKALAVLPPEQHRISMSWRVKTWPMLLNNQYGVCTCASAAHHKHISAIYGLKPYTVTDADVLRMYEASGFNPADPNTDRGWMLADAAGYCRTTGLQGTPDITAYAHVDLHDEDAQQVAHWLFGGLYVGASLPLSAQSQYRQGQIWDVTNGGQDAGSWGGHCMLRINSTVHGHGTYVTWGGLQVASEAWQKAYVDEVMILVPVEWEAHMPAYMKKYDLVDFAKLQSLVAQVTTA